MQISRVPTTRNYARHCKLQQEQKINAHTPDNKEEYNMTLFRAQLFIPSFTPTYWCDNRKQLSTRTDLRPFEKILEIQTHGVNIKASSSICCSEMTVVLPLVILVGAECGSFILPMFTRSDGIKF